MSSNTDIDLSQGSTFFLQGKQQTIIGRLDMDHVLARSGDGKTTQRLAIDEIIAEETGKYQDQRRKFAALETIDDNKWDEVAVRQNAILSVNQGNSLEMIAQGLKISTRHLLVLRRKYQTYGIESLVRLSPTGGAGKSRLDETPETVLISAINDEYLNKQKKCVARVIEEVESRCRVLKIPPPGRNTVYRRCKSINAKVKEMKRHGRKAAKNKFDQTLDGYQEATRPLEIIQIDHTLMDIIIVDEETRQPIGRPWLTIAIDVYSRMVYGFVISLDPPSAMSSALCLQQAICKKDKWLADREINHSWGIYGLLEALHMDNGKDFHSKTLRRGCQKYEVHMYYRPVGKTEYGAHIERLIGTFMQYMKVLPGATFSNIEEKGDYDAEKESAKTLTELEKWFGTLVTGRYHKQVHSSLHMNPEQKFLEGLQGSQKIPGAGINRIIVDEEDLLMDFTPYFEKTIQNYGIRIDHIHYNSEALKPFVNMIDKKTGKKRKFLVRRDPRDISVIHLFLPDEERYVTIPYRNKSFPKISLFEHRWALNALKERGKIDSITEDEIFRTLKELKEIEEQAVKKTKTVRRANERIKLHRLSSGTSKPNKKPKLPDINEVPVDEEVEPFDEIETIVSD